MATMMPPLTSNSFRVASGVAGHLSVVLPRCDPARLQAPPRTSRSWYLVVAVDQPPLPLIRYVPVSHELGRHRHLPSGVLSHSRTLDQLAAQLILRVRLRLRGARDGEAPLDFARQLVPALPARPPSG